MSSLGRWTSWKSEMIERGGLLKWWKEGHGTDGRTDKVNENKRCLVGMVSVPRYYQQLTFLTKSNITRPKPGPWRDSNHRPSLPKQIIYTRSLIFCKVNPELSVRSGHVFCCEMWNHEQTNIKHSTVHVGDRCVTPRGDSQNQTNSRARNKGKGSESGPHRPHTRLNGNVTRRVEAHGEETSQGESRLIERKRH